MRAERLYQYKDDTRVIFDHISRVKSSYGHYIIRRIITIIYCIILQGRIILEVSIICIPLFREGIISQYTPLGIHFTVYSLGQILDVLYNSLVQKGFIQRVKFQYFILKNSIMCNRVWSKIRTLNSSSRNQTNSDTEGLSLTGLLCLWRTWLQDEHFESVCDFQNTVCNNFNDVNI